VVGISTLNAVIRIGGSPVSLKSTGRFCVAYSPDDQYREALWMKLSGPRGR
jgi:hypothetical protein